MRWLGHEGRTLMNRISVLREETTERSLSHVKTYKTGKGFSLDTESAVVLIWKVSACRTVRNKIFVYLMYLYMYVYIHVLHKQRNKNKSDFVQWSNASFNLDILYTGSIFCIVGEVSKFCEAMPLFYTLGSFTFIFAFKAEKPTRFDPHWAGNCQSLRNLSKAVIARGGKHHLIFGALYNWYPRRQILLALEQVPKRFFQQWNEMFIRCNNYNKLTITQEVVKKYAILEHTF